MHRPVAAALKIRGADALQLRQPQQTPASRAAAAISSLEGDPAGFTLVLQMVRGSTLVLPLAERRCNDTFGLDSRGGAPDDAAGWPEEGALRWSMPAEAAHEQEIAAAALWRRADNRYCVFRDLSPSPRPRSTARRPFRELWG